jgi:hypothetical protein
MLVGVAVVVAVGAIFAVGTRTGPSSGGSAPHYPEAGSGVRTLVVAPMGAETMSSASGPLAASLLHGSVPDQPTMATVVSDAKCTPDPMGVSHCTNMLRMDDGSELSVQHNHRMMDTPCLSPGERVLVSSS